MQPSDASDSTTAHHTAARPRRVQLLPIPRITRIVRIGFERQQGRATAPTTVMVYWAMSAPVTLPGARGSPPRPQADDGKRLRSLASPPGGRQRPRRAGRSGHRRQPAQAMQGGDVHHGHRRGFYREPLLQAAGLALIGVRPRDHLHGGRVGNGGTRRERGRTEAPPCAPPRAGRSTGDGSRS